MRHLDLATIGSSGVFVHGLVGGGDRDVVNKACLEGGGGSDLVQAGGRGGSIGPFAVGTAEGG